MHASAHSPSRWRSSRRRLAWLVLAAGACGEDGRSAAATRIDAQPVEPAVITHVAERDGLDETAARARVLETLRLVAAARAERPTDEAELSDARREHLLRTARARVLLHDDFEANHGVDDIAAGDPLLARARDEQRFVHPAIHHVCQIIAQPPGKLDPEALAAQVAEPTWQARAMARMTEVTRHVRDTVPLGDPQACKLMLRGLELDRVADEPDVVLRGEGSSGFDLDACAVAPAADGSCAEPRFAPEWVAEVRSGAIPGLRGPFVSRFGVHLVLVMEILPRNMPGDAEFESRLREALHPHWQLAALNEWLASLRTRHAALLAAGAE